MRNISEERMKKLIEIADKARLSRDWFTKIVIVLLYLAVVLLLIIPFMIIFNPAKLSLEQWQISVNILGVGVACLALTLALLSLFKKIFEVQTINSVDKEFQRLSKNVKDSEKILLRVLIAMKIKQPDVSLTELFNLYPSMFDEYTIIKRMYG